MKVKWLKFSQTFDMYQVYLLIMSSFQARSDLKMEFFHLTIFLLSHIV
jgi:hypothetical protein